MNQEKLNYTVKVLTDFLARKEYYELSKFTGGIRLSATDIEQSVNEYGREVIEFPEEGYQQLDIIEIDNSTPKQWSVNVPVYTKEEGMSDLTLELTLIDTPSELYGAELNNLHVL